MAIRSRAGRRTHRASSARPHASTDRPEKKRVDCLDEVRGPRVTQMSAGACISASWSSALRTDSGLGGVPGREGMTRPAVGNAAELVVGRLVTLASAAVRPLYTDRCLRPEQGRTARAVPPGGRPGPSLHVDVGRGGGLTPWIQAGWPSFVTRQDHVETGAAGRGGLDESERGEHDDGEAHEDAGDHRRCFGDATAEPSISSARRTSATAIQRKSFAPCDASIAA